MLLWQSEGQPYHSQMELWGLKKFRDGRVKANGGEYQPGIEKLLLILLLFVFLKQEEIRKE